MRLMQYYFWLFSLYLPDDDDDVERVEEETDEGVEFKEESTTEVELETLCICF
jgi:hypothetical protein